MIKFDKVTKCYKDVTVVSEISLRLDVGCTHVLLGQSGSGKSTLIRLAAGLVAPTSGSIFLGDENASQLPPRRRAQIFGYMIQDGGLFPHMTCRNNALLPAKIQGIPLEPQQNRFETLCEMVNLPLDLMERYPRQLSGGQRQRVALVRSLILDPQILFLDEPLGALDPIVRSGLQEELRSVFRRLNKTVILVTHDLAEAAYFADTITLLTDGHIEQHGTLDQLMESPSSNEVTEYFRAQRPPPSLVAWVNKGEGKRE